MSPDEKTGGSGGSKDSPQTGGGKQAQPAKPGEGQGGRNEKGPGSADDTTREASQGTNGRPDCCEEVLKELQLLREELEPLKFLVPPSVAVDLPQEHGEFLTELLSALQVPRWNLFTGEFPSDGRGLGDLGLGAVPGGAGGARRA